MCAARELAPGRVVPDLTEPNLLQPERVRKAIERRSAALAADRAT